MGTIAEERKRERPVKFVLLISILSFLPFIGTVFIIPALVLAILFYLLSKRYPEKYGGIVRLRISFLLILLAFVLQYIFFFVFFNYKIRQAEEAKYQITSLRLYCAAEILENYERERGVYPEGDNAEELEKQLDSEGIIHIPFKDGWDRDFLIKSRPWDYRLTAQCPPKIKERDFPLLRGQKPKPVFPYVGSQEDYRNLTVE